ncbi:MAG TPA: DNA polymerase III subunit alpha, partial [Anaerolineales bacterium]|nr:DNA polymerase III subunit alpha [Anaerolineales bacterium]
MNSDDRLSKLCHTTLAQKIVSDKNKYILTLDHELSMISEYNLANYFLVVWDLICFARKNNILCQGRGSAANSLVAYLLGITPIDPLDTGLVFERFLSRERSTTPDIDIDFAADRREEVIQYIYNKYGPEQVSMACTIVTFRARSALRDVGLALGFEKDTLQNATAVLDDHSASSLPESKSIRAILKEDFYSPRWQELLRITALLEGFPRHLGIHNGGMIVSKQKLTDCMPIEPASMQERTVVQWDKDSLELMSWIKLDVLGLRMLSAISDACALINPSPELEKLRFDDPDVFDMICRGETIGVFQIESRAQSSLIPRFKPRSLADLTIQVALIRPGPLQSNMVHPYLLRREGRNPTTYLHPLLKPALKETLGVILFQEQVLKIARDL